MLSESQRAAVAERLRRGRTPVTGVIPRRGAEVTDLPLSFGQEQLWFIDQFAPGMATYNIPGATRLHGPLDPAALGRAVDALVARHESLRTRLVTVAGRPVQVVDEPSAVGLPVTDLSALAPPDRAAELQRLAAEEAVRPFRLADGPLFRSQLVRLADDEHVWLYCVHHTVFDGWSGGVLYAELAALYQAEATGTPAGLPELPIQYADYALWERGRMQGDVLAELVDYWREALKGVPTVQMPTDRPRPLLQSFEGGLERLSMGADVIPGLRELSRREGTTLFVALLAAVQVLLHRYSGQDDIVVGTASANRSRAELAPLIGYLVNTLAIRTDLSGDPTFPEVLRRVRDTTVQAYAHQDVSFAKLVEALRVERDASRSPIVQIGFTMAEDTGDAFVGGGVAFRQEVVDLLPAKFDLNFFAGVHGNDLVVDLSYATALFDVGTVRRMLGHLRVLLAGVVADSSRPLSRLPVLPADELHRELVEWNDTAAEYPVICLHERFEAQVARTPDGVAAEMDGESWSYAQLNARANQIARRLREYGVQREVLVGVSMQPSPRRLAALLGILKAGGGWVPLDSELPAERLTYLVDDSHTPVVITDRASAASLPPTSAALLSLDDEWDSIAALDDTNPGFPVAPSNVAYVIYTSGSTGRPKGVVVEHAPTVNYVHGMIERWPLGPGDKILQFASLNFDVSVMDMFLAMCSGGTAVLGTRETLLSPPRLADLMRGRGVTFAVLPPAVVNLLTGQDFPALRVLISAGEALSSELVRGWLRPGLRFCNGYGPTEAVIGATVIELDGTIFPPPIGRPLANYQAYVLDAHLNPVPVGVVGELHLGGAGIARGYLNQPELTAQRFIADPFAGTPDARLYKTGDLVKRLPDGNIQFLGRVDDQVKIRGLRVELGEIESVMAAHPAVAQAVVVVVDDQSGQKQLVGYVRDDPNGPGVSHADLRQHLAQHLPGYMVPPYLLTLDTFPLNANGKIDKAALPAPDRRAATTAYVAPRTLVETIVADTYANLLSLERVGVEDSFFDLGGNSLQAMQLITRLRNDLAVDADVTAIFLAPTPGQLAVLLRDRFGLDDGELDGAALDGEALDGEALDGAALDGAAVEPAPPGSAVPAVSRRLVTLNEGPAGSPLFIVHAVGGTVYAYAPLARELADTFKVYGIEAAGLGEGETAPDSLGEMVAEYVDAIRGVQPDGPYRLAGWSMGGVVAFEIARRIEEQGATVALLALLDTPFSLPKNEIPDEPEYPALFVADASRTLGAPAGGPPDPASSTTADQLGWLVDQLGGGGDGDDRAAIGAQIERRFQVFTANMRALRGYRPRAVLDADALIVGATRSLDSAPRWSGVITGDIQTVRLDGDHYALLSPAGVQEIAVALRKYVD